MSSDERVKALAEIAAIEVAELSAPKKRGLLDILPEGWLRDYVALCQVLEAPDTFHFFAGLAVFSQAIGRNVGYSIGLEMIYAPINVFLISPAGAARRSGAIIAAREIARDTGINIIQDTVTPEGLLAAIRDEPATLLAVDEAANLLNKTDYMAQMSQILCTLLDCGPRFDRTLKATRHVIEKPTVNVLMGCAPEWIVTSMPRSATGGGLFSRMLLIFEKTRARDLPFASEIAEPEAVAVIRDRLVSGLKAISQSFATPSRLNYVPGPTKEKYREFYINNGKHEIDDEKMAIYMTRKPAHLNRLIMNLLASEGRKDMIVDETTYDTAMAILAMVEEGMQKAYQNTALERHGQIAQKMVLVLEKTNGTGMGHSELLRKTGLSAKEFKDTIDTLIDAGDVVREDKLVPNKGLKPHYKAVSR